MNEIDFTELKKKVEQAKIKKSKAEGAIEEIQNRWKKEFDCSSIEEVSQLMETLTKQIKSQEEKMKQMTIQLETELSKYESE